MPRLITTKYRGACKLCRATIPAGTTAAYHGRGAGLTCTACHEEADADAADYIGENDQEPPGCEPGTLASDRRLARRGLTVVRFSSGASFTQNSRGRCIDAPCCGCCS
jgi:hypothetical protein